MAKATGFTCDKCGKFDTAVENGSSAQLPGGWIMVTPMPKVYPGTEARPVVAALELCSNKCLVELSLERYEAEYDKPYKPSRTTVPNSQKGHKYEKEECPAGCGRKLAPQGKPGHMKKFHPDFSS